jgi:hypothetical protein
VIAAIEGRVHVHSEYALVSDVIVAGEGATFNDLTHFALGIVPGDGIFTTWSYRAGAGRMESLLLNPEAMTARAHCVQSLKERLLREVGDGLALGGASAADLVKSMRIKN